MPRANTSKYAGRSSGVRSGGGSTSSPGALVLTSCRGIALIGLSKNLNDLKKMENAFFYLRDKERAVLLSPSAVLRSVGWFMRSEESGVWQKQQLQSALIP